MGRLQPELPGDEAMGAAERAAWRRALAAALEGPALRRSERGRQLLSYLVEETLAGRRDRITGITIAQDVLGRDETFDGDADAIVRVQMRRLRMQLAEDQAAGAAGPGPRIAVPKGAYRPELVPGPAAPLEGAEGRAPEAGSDPGPEAGPAPGPGLPPPADPPAEPTGLSETAAGWGPAPAVVPTAAPAAPAPGGPRGRAARAAPVLVAAAVMALLIGAFALWLADRAEEAVAGAERPGRPPGAEEYPSVGVLPFQNLTGDPEMDVLETAFQLQLASNLQRFDTITAFTVEEPRDDEEVGGRRGVPEPRYVVRGDIISVEPAASVHLQLADAGTQLPIRSRRLSKRGREANDLGDHLAVLSRIALLAGGRIGGDYGDIEGAETIRAIALEEVMGPSGVEAFHCVVLAHAFRQTRMPEELRIARACLEARLEERPGDAVATAYLAFVALHAMPRMGAMESADIEWTPSAEEVLATAARAVSLDPGSDTALAVRGAILTAFDRPYEAVEVLERAIEVNPANPSATGLLALALLGADRWDEAVEMADRAIALSTLPEADFHLPGFIVGLRDDDQDAVGLASEAIGRKPPPWAEVTFLLSAQMRGDTSAVERLKPEVLKFAQEHGGDALAGLRRLIPSPRALTMLGNRLAEVGIEPAPEPPPGGPGGASSGPAAP